MNTAEKRGYKQSEAGGIPSDWGICQLGDVGKWFSGGTPRMSNDEYWGGDIPWVSAKDMKVSRLFDSQDHISRKAVTDGARLVPPGTVLMVIRGMILAHTFPVARAECPLAFNQDLKAVVAADSIDSNYLLFWLIGNASFFLGLTTESTHGTKRLPPETLYRVPFPLPTLAEQEAIATALSDADALIESLEQLVAKKQQIKQGTMQELLSGQKRLPGFESRGERQQTEVGNIPLDWEVKAVREFASIKTGPFGTLLKASEYSVSDGVPLISVGEIRSGYLRITSETPRVSSVITRRLPQYVLNAGDIVFGRKGGVDRSALIRPEHTGWFLGSDGIAVRPVGGQSSNYLALQFQSRRIQQWLIQNAIGTTMPSLNQGILRKVLVPLPPTKAEQEAIAGALGDMDAEIEELSTKLAKARLVKQAMMQELLTGRTRLV